MTETDKFRARVEELVRNCIADIEYHHSISPVSAEACKVFSKDATERAQGEHFDWRNSIRYLAAQLAFTSKGKDELTGPGAKPLSEMTYQEMRKVYPRE